MIKKKSPVLLVTIVAAVGLGMVVLNMTGFLANPGGLPEFDAADKEAMQEVQKRQQASAGDRIKTMKERSMFSIGPGGQSANLKTGVPDTPSIAMPNMKQVVPKYDPETTSSHWYEDDSLQKVNADKKKGG
jgi:hypothetical protein